MVAAVDPEVQLLINKASDLSKKIDWQHYTDHPVRLPADDPIPTVNRRYKTPDGHHIPLSPESEKTTWNLVRNDLALAFREQLMPRGPTSSSYLVDRNKDIDDECGYPRWITPWQYRYMYDREGIATRVVDIIPNECWALLPEIYEDEDEKVTTLFEQSFKSLNEELNLLHYIKRVDKQSRIGYYGILLYGLNDRNLDGTAREMIQEVAGTDPHTGEALPVDLNNPDGEKVKLKHKLLYIRTMDETQVRVLSYEADRNNPRYAQPYLYYVRFIDVVRGETGAIAGMITAHVHWSRIEHIAPNRGSSEVYGTPELQNVYNRIYDLRKVLSSSGEMFWKGGFPGYSFEVNPDIAAEVNFNTDEMKEEIFRFQAGLQRFLAIKGLTVKSLATQVSSPKDHFDTLVRAICITKGYPLRVFMGTEQQQRTASTEEVKGWNKVVGSIQQDYTSPWVLRPIINKLIKYGCIDATLNKSYKIHWPDLNTISDADKAELSFKRTQAMAQYINSFVYHLVWPKQFLVSFLYLAPEQADMIIESQGGEKAILANLERMMSMAANSLDGNVQVKTSNTAADSAKKKGKKNKGGGVEKTGTPTASTENSTRTVTPTSQGGVSNGY